MFYIDFTSPEGKTYRIDLSELPITYVCPVCGDEQIVLLHNPDSADWCDCFEERYKEKKKEK